jgi:hypothetical protein
MVPFTTVIAGTVTDPKFPRLVGDSWHAGAEVPLPLANAPFTTVIAGTVTDPKIPAAVGDSWRPAAASLLGVAPLAAVAALSAMSLMGTASAPARHPDASTAHATMTSGGTAPRSGARGPETLLPLGNAPFTTVIAAGMTDTKLPPYKGD